MAKKKGGSTRAEKDKRRKKRQASQQRRSANRHTTGLARLAMEWAGDQGLPLPDDPRSVLGGLLTHYRTAAPERFPDDGAEGWYAELLLDAFYDYLVIYADPDGHADRGAPADVATRAEELTQSVVAFARFLSDRDPLQWPPEKVDLVESETAGALAEVADAVAADGERRVANEEASALAEQLGLPEELAEVEIPDDSDTVHEVRAVGDALNVWSWVGDAPGGVPADIIERAGEDRLDDLADELEIRSGTLVAAAWLAGLRTGILVTDGETVTATPSPVTTALSDAALSDVPLPDRHAAGARTLATEIILSAALGLLDTTAGTEYGPEAAGTGVAVEFGHELAVRGRIDDVRTENPHAEDSDRYDVRRRVDRGRRLAMTDLRELGLVRLIDGRWWAAGGARRILGMLAILWLNHLDDLQAGDDPADED